MKIHKSRPQSPQESPQASSKVGGKQSFDSIYNEADPRSYYRALEPLGYRVAEHARPIAEAAMRALSDLRGKPRLTLLDLCCGYGINGSLLRHSLSMADLYERYADPELDDLGSEELAASDRRFYAQHRGNSTSGLVGEILGMDAADKAVRYAEKTGLIDRGAAINLEREELPEALRAELADVDLITVTGGMGYVTDVTFRKILSATSAKARPWVLSFPLRGLDLGRFERVFADYGLETETWDSLVPQRRFADAAERQRTLGRLEESGIDPAPERRDDSFFAQVYLARPVDEQVRLADLVERALERTPVMA